MREGGCGGVEGRWMCWLPPGDDNERLLKVLLNGRSFMVASMVSRWGIKVEFS